MRLPGPVAALLLLSSAVQAQPASSVETALKQSLPFGLDAIHWTMKAIPGAQKPQGHEWGTGLIWGTSVVLPVYAWKGCSLRVAFWFNSEGGNLQGGEIGNVLLTTTGPATAVCRVQMRAELTARLGEPEDNKTLGQLSWPTEAASRAARIFSEECGGLINDSSRSDSEATKCGRARAGSWSSDAVLTYPNGAGNVVLWRPGMPHFLTP